MKRVVVITRPDFFEGELEIVVALFRAGLQLLHLRKPGALAHEIETFIEKIPKEFWGRVVLHDHFHLVSKYGLRGIHLNSRANKLPIGYKGQISCSCHSFEEIKQCKEKSDYLFLSPIYDSISKEGYKASFTSEELADACKEGIIDQKVIALGGVTIDKFLELSSLGFGGVAMLGDIWSRDCDKIVDYFKMIKSKVMPPIILTIAGSDSSGGAGIQADIKAISANGGYAASVITAVTAQNTMGVTAIHEVPQNVVSGQIDAVMSDLKVDSVKIGMLHSMDIIDCVVRGIVKYAPEHVVYDPVMISTSGSQLMREECVEYVKSRLLPLATLITPNIHEAMMLSGRKIGGVSGMEIVAQELSEEYGCAVLVKGGHLDGNLMCDVLWYKGKLYHFNGVRIDSVNTHGTGCTLSSAIATFLARGFSLPDAIGEAKEYVAAAIAGAKDWSIGHGAGPLAHFVGSE